MKRQANAHVANTEHFIDLCRKFDIKPTKRQASKYQMKKGYLYKRISGIEDIPLQKSARMSL